MATLTLTVVTVDKDAKSITLKATTDGVAPTAGTLKWRYWTETAFKDMVLTGAQVTSLFAAGGLLLTPDLVGLTTVVGTVFADGEHQVQFDDANSADLADVKILVNKAAERCITSAIGKLAMVDCDCREAELALNRLVRWRFAADVQHDCKDYDGAHNLIVSIGKLCGGADCGC